MDRTRPSCYVESIITPAFFEAAEATGCAAGDLMYFFISVVRPVMEYACRVWHTGLTAAQSDSLEFVQKRAMHIMYSDDNSGDYKTRIIISGVEKLKDRREVLTERFVKRHVFPSSSLLHYLGPTPMQIGVTMTLLIVSDIHNHSTNCGRVLPDFSTVLYHIA